MERVIVERRPTEPMSVSQVRESSCSVAVCFKLHRVRHLRSVISADGLRVICEYEAPDAESVRRANLQARLPFERVWTAQVFEVEAASV